MRRIAILAYYFPPLGGAGVQRIVKLCEQLPSLGWEPVVVTGPGAGGERWSPRDETLGSGLGNVEVVRLAGPEPALGGGRSERWLRRPSAWARWWVEGAAAALAGLAEIDLVLASLSPFEGSAAAARGARMLGVPWVADLRDPWALDEMLAYPSALHRIAERRAMRRALSSATAIVLNTKEATAAFATAFPELAARALEPVPNGFDPDDLAVAPVDRSDRAFRIVHTGYLHTDLSTRGLRAATRAVLGGAVRGVDIGSRSHLYLLEAIDRLRSEDPSLADRIEVHLAGALTAEDIATADRPYVHRLGYLSHAESIALARSADALFLPMHDLARPRRARIVPGKTYEYLAAGRPILAAVPDGDARDLLARAGNAILCRPRDVDGLTRALRTLVSGEGPSGEAVPDVLALFERRALAARMAAVLDRVVAPQTA